MCQVRQLNFCQIYHTSKYSTSTQKWHPKILTPFRTQIRIKPQLWHWNKLYAFPAGTYPPTSVDAALANGSHTAQQSAKSKTGTGITRKSARNLLLWTSRRDMYPQLAGIGTTTMTSRCVVWQDERADSETLSLQVLDFLGSGTLNPRELGRLVGYVHSPVTDENRSPTSLGTITIFFACRRNS